MPPTAAAPRATAPRAPDVLAPRGDRDGSEEDCGGSRGDREEAGREAAQEGDARDDRVPGLHALAPDAGLAARQLADGRARAHRRLTPKVSGPGRLSAPAFTSRSARSKNRVTRRSYTCGYVASPAVCCASGSSQRVTGPRAFAA